MLRGWAYRAASVAGAGVITMAAVLVSNAEPAQQLFTTYVPLFWRLEPVYLAADELVLALFLNTVIVMGAFLPLYKPQPRRVLDVFFLAQKRVVAAVMALATLGYFNYTYRLPRTTVAMSGGILLVALPAQFVWTRQSPNGEVKRAVLVGNDVDQIGTLLAETDLPYVGYLCPTRMDREVRQAGDGGVRRLGGLSRIEDVLVEREIDTVVLAFREPDRGEFFGALDACYEHGVHAKVHQRFADSVITKEGGGDVLVDVAIEPWDLQDYAFKRLFDVGFAAVGLPCCYPSPSLSDDGGLILYTHI